MHTCECCILAIWVKEFIHLFLRTWRGANFLVKPVSQSRAAVAKSENSGATGQSNLAYKRLASKKRFQSLVFVTTQTALWPMEQSSILSAKMDLTAPQNLSLLATAHDCETGLYTGWRELFLYDVSMWILLRLYGGLVGFLFLYIFFNNRILHGGNKPSMRWNIEIVMVTRSA